MFTAGRHVDFLDQLIPGFVRAPLRLLVKGYRRLTAPFRVLPDFLIIGGRRCGTTSLYRYLAEHPSVMPALAKELFYFTHHYEKGELWYRLNFPTVFERWLSTLRRGVRPLTGEATPIYIRNPAVPERVYQMNPAVKVIAILRDPVAAAYSAYQFGLLHCTYTEEERSFRRLVLPELALLLDGQPLPPDADPDLLLTRYIYVDHLSRWFDVFPREQIFLLGLESLVRSPQEHYDRLLQFLGLPPHRLQVFEQHNANAYKPMDADLYTRLRDFYRPHNARLAEYTGLSFPLTWDEEAAGQPLANGTDGDGQHGGKATPERIDGKDLGHSR